MIEEIDIDTRIDTGWISDIMMMSQDLEATAADIYLKYR